MNGGARSLFRALGLCLPPLGVLLGGIGAWAWLRPRAPAVAPHVAPEAAALPFRFEEMGPSSGVRFTADPGPPNFFLPEIIGFGAAVVDVDGDGLQDLVFRGAVAGAPHPKGAAGRSTALFRQVGAGRFVDASADSGIDHEGYGMGVATGDVNNDGLPDLYLTNYGGDALYLNLGGGKFARVDAGLRNAGWASSAAFFDFDRDGRLDLYVCNYCDYRAEVACKLSGGREDYCSPKTFNGSVHRLYRNETPAGAKRPGEIRFRDVTVASGVGAKRGRGLGVAPVDLDDDGWPDLYVANDAERNFAWINGRNGAFQDRAPELNLAMDGFGRPQGSMGIATGDVDEDGRADIVVTALRGEYTIVYRRGEHAFTDAAGRFGLALATRARTGFGVALADFDADGHLDMVQANGGVNQVRPTADAATRADSRDSPEGAAAFWRLYEEPVTFLKGDGRSFRDALDETGELAEVRGVLRGLAVGDLDGDGRPDLVLVPTASA
ncbi:MAG TPA: FG-GAP-like repeat-containing protein, partial [Planctomycetia bacterium]|nr:FG-GAP-like repeat-containing protein [Planctomycetia bacterium]